MNQAWLFNQGKNYQSYRMLGARPSVSPDGESGYRFAVWAPRAQAVSVVGDFNGWDSNTHHLQPVSSLFGNAYTVRVKRCGSHIENNDDDLASISIDSSVGEYTVLAVIGI
jgi:1,4-alpha-glucan branching enzyme